jgi:signal transduction histidine kinase
VIQNIISNAIKYGDHIQVLVLDEVSEVQIEVENNGPGLEVEQLKHSIVTTDRSRDAESTHLGLSVSLYLISKCMGQLGVSSEPEKGATFYLVLQK